MALTVNFSERGATTYKLYGQAELASGIYVATEVKHFVSSSGNSYTNVMANIAYNMDRYSVDLFVDIDAEEIFMQSAALLM
ncbi:MAG: hypothetical protein JKX69_03680 [Rhodobacteraceae bacterium]|nr:hypothetical protein [Paracoccaceae bacterium]